MNNTFLTKKKLERILSNLNDLLAFEKKLNHMLHTLPSNIEVPLSHLLCLNYSCKFISKIRHYNQVLSKEVIQSIVNEIIDELETIKVRKKILIKDSFSYISNMTDAFKHNALCKHYGLEYDPGDKKLPYPETLNLSEVSQLLGCSTDNVLRICIESPYFHAYVKPAKYDLQMSSRSYSNINPIEEIDNYIKEYNLDQDYQYPYEGLIRLMKRLGDPSQGTSKFTLEAIRGGGVIKVEYYEFLPIHCSISELIKGYNVFSVLSSLNKIDISSEDLVFVKKEIDSYSHHNPPKVLHQESQSAADAKIDAQVRKNMSIYGKKAGQQKREDANQRWLDCMRFATATVINNPNKFSARGLAIFIDNQIKEGKSLKYPDGIKNENFVETFRKKLRKNNDIKLLLL